MASETVNMPFMDEPTEAIVAKKPAKAWDFCYGYMDWDYYRAKNGKFYAVARGTHPEKTKKRGSR